jgi:hypothetical protein
MKLLRRVAAMVDLIGGAAIIAAGLSGAQAVLPRRCMSSHASRCNPSRTAFCTNCAEWLPTAADHRRIGNDIRHWTRPVSDHLVDGEADQLQCKVCLVSVPVSVFSTTHRV